MVEGDFNVIHFMHEKNPRRRITRSMRDSEDFSYYENNWDNLLSNVKYT